MTKICKYCRSQIDDKASVCPFCQRKQSDFGGALKAVIITLLIIFIGIPFSIGFFKGIKKSASNNTVDVSVITADINTTEPPKTKSIVVYEQNGIKITYTGIEEGSYRTELRFLIENDTDIEYCVQERSFSANGYMLSANMSAVVSPHKKANNCLSVTRTTLEKNNISSIESAEFYFHIFNYQDWSQYFDSATITINIEQ